MNANVAHEIAVKLIGKNGDLNRSLQDSTRKGEAFGTKMVHAGSRAAGGIGLVTAAAAAAVTGMHAINMEAAQMAREIQGLMASANMGAVALQSIGYATSDVGIGLEKAADIMKDVQEKMGDFSSTGGGEFADFMENVGSKVGLTINELQRMSGPDALIAVKKAMDDLNVPMGEQITYMEALANDASRLIPLLADNGAKFRELREEYTATNSAMTESEMANYKDYAKDVDALTASFSALVREATGPFVQDMAEGARYFAEIFGRQRKATLANNINELHHEMVELQEQIAASEKHKPKEFFDGVLFEGAKTRRWRQILEDRKARLKEVREEIGRLQEHSAQLDGKPADAPLATGVSPAAPSKAGNGASNDLANAQAQGAQRLAAMDMTFADELARMQLQHAQRVAEIEKLQLSEEEVRRRGFDSLEALQDEYKTRSQDKLNTEQEAHALRLEEQAMAELDRVRNQLIEREMVEQEAYDRRQAILDQRYDEGLLKEQNYQDLSLKNWKKYQDTLAKMESQKKIEQLRNGQQLFDGLAGMTEAFAGEQSGIYKAMFAASKAFAIAEAVINIQGSIAKAANFGVFPANLAAMGTVIGATGSILSTIKSTQMAGQAHDGMDFIPGEGTWNLEKGERVYTNAQARKVDAVHDRVLSSPVAQAQPAASGQRPFNVHIINKGEPVQAAGTNWLDDENLELLLERVDQDQAEKASSGAGANIQVLETMGLNRAAAAQR